jgi:hypothetical protein
MTIGRQWVLQKKEGFYLRKRREQDTSVFFSLYYKNRKRKTRTKIWCILLVFEPIRNVTNV